MKRTFFVEAVWDEDANVFYSKSDIEGFHIESETIEEFEDVMRDTAIELIMENHVTASEMATSSLKDLVPAILWQRPQKAMAIG